MTTSTKLGIPYLANQQATPEIYHNEALYMLEAMLRGVITRTNAPPGSPVDGDSYLITAVASGAWTGWENHVAIWASNAWRFVPGFDTDGAVIAIGATQEGMRVYVNDENTFYVWSGAAWAAQTITAANVSFTPAGNIVAINAQAAIEELDSEKVAKAGDTMTGQLRIDHPTAAANGILIQNGVSGSGSANLNIIGDAITTNIQQTRNSTNSGGPTNTWRVSRGTHALPTVVLTGQIMRTFTMSAHDGSGYVTAASEVVSIIEATPGPAAMGARHVLSLAPVGSVTNTEVRRWEHGTGLSMYGANVVIDSNRLARRRVYTFGTLPAAGTQSRFASISDGAAAPVWGAVAAGGGAVYTPVYDDGANWRNG
jgi:hypothetical protein